MKRDPYLTIRITPEIREELKLDASFENKTVQDIVFGLIRKHLDARREVFLARLEARKKTAA
jgi:hypothetical protein